MLKSIVIPRSVESIGEEAFQFCGISNNIMDFHFENQSSLRLIGSKAFQNCFIANFSLPPNVEYIYNNTFFYCKKLVIFTVPENSSLISIGDRAFCSCEKLITFMCMKEIQSIGKYAFAKCFKLSHFYYYGTKEPELGKDIFKECVSLKEIFVLAKYKNNSFGGIKITRHT